MSNVAESLRTLHRLHSKIGGLTEQIARGPRQIAAGESRLQSCQAALAEAKEKLKRTKIRADEKQLQLKGREDRIADLKGKLNAAASNREYQALKEQIQADEQANSVLTDEILELLERIDRVADEVEAAESEVTGAERHLSELRDRVAGASEALMAQLNEAQTELAAVEKNLPDDLRKEYDRIIRLRGGEGLAMVEGESCGACYQTLTPQMMNELVQGKAIFCSSCGAIIFVGE